ncbi:MAG: hypothetical protein I3274_05850, partial [Candidatus Moeniiplasma glomeromycotorum]|nr:hypothetical protein [Candidatus Moeniiplasma glomeromycotorum]
MVSQKSLSKQKNNPIRSNDSTWNIFGFFLLISFPFALIFTIIFWLSDIKTIFWSEKGTTRHPWFRGYIAVFILLWIYLTFFLIFLSVLFFLLVSLGQKKSRIQRKKAGQYLSLFLIDQTLFNLFSFLLWKRKIHDSSTKILLICFLLIIVNSFLLHYFFSKPAMNLLAKKYPA